MLSITDSNGISFEGKKEVLFECFPLINDTFEKTSESIIEFPVIDEYIMYLLKLSHHMIKLDISTNSRIVQYIKASLFLGVCDTFI